MLIGEDSKQLHFKTPTKPPEREKHPDSVMVMDKNLYFTGADRTWYGRGKGQTA